MSGGRGGVFGWLCLWACLSWALVATPAMAQVSAPDTPLLSVDYADDAAWQSLAQRAETLVARGTASAFSVARIRAELTGWRDHFLGQTDQNAGRLATVASQIAALGAAPESGQEPDAIAARRAALMALQAELLAPRLLAQESFARANGLIGELDMLILQQQTAALFERGPSPLAPAALPAAVAAGWAVIAGLGQETLVGLQVQAGNGQLWRNLPRALLLLAAALLLGAYLRPWLVRLRRSLPLAGTRWAPLLPFALSLLQILVSFLGLLALSEGLATLAIFGLRGSALVAAIPSAGMALVFGWWLGRQVFMDGSLPRYLGYGAETRHAARRYTLALAGVIGAGALFDAAAGSTEMASAVGAVLAWPVLAILGLLLWRLGQLIRRPAEQTDPGEPRPARLRGMIGQACGVVAVVGPVLAALGYGAAGRALLVAAILSLALLGVVLVLQRIVQDIAARRQDTEETKGIWALLPVLVSFAIYLASLPFLALIWGARTDDLVEIWSRFREGFALGETRVSPTDFLTFIAVFAAGYGLTRLVQGSLRRSVLPRTNLDLGGQNAVVAGFGYLGIFLAAVVAITSAGIDLSSLAIVAGALSVGIGFGLQNIVSNFVSGIILLIERPISEGDWIEVGGQMGYVRAISVRSTRIETFDRSDVIIPNADLVSGQVINWTRGNLIGRVIVPVGVAYGSDTAQVEKILTDIAETHPMVVMVPPPAVLFTGFGASSLDFEIRAILRDVNFGVRVKSDMNHAIAKRFAAEGIEIPFPQTDLWLRNPETLKAGRDDPSLVP